MKKIGLCILGLIFSIITYGQILKIQGGTSISKLDWELKGVDFGPLYNDVLIGYSIFAGLDYLNKEYFNLSSNIGMIRKGGKMDKQEINESGEPIGGPITEKATLDYLSINTTFDLKYPINDKISPFISCGPRIDYLVNNSQQLDALKDNDGFENASIGLNIGGGLNFNISKIQIGLRADYYLNFTKIADWKFEESGTGGELSDRTFMINLTLGYRLK